MGQSESLAARTEQASTPVCSIKVPAAAALWKVLLPLFWTQLSQKLAQGGARFFWWVLGFFLNFFFLIYSGIFLVHLLDLKKKIFLLKGDFKPTFVWILVKCCHIALQEDVNKSVTPVTRNHPPLLRLLWF